MLNVGNRFGEEISFLSNEIDLLCFIILIVFIYKHILMNNCHKF